MSRLTEHLTVDHGVRLPRRRPLVVVDRARVCVGAALLMLARWARGGL